MQRKLNEELIKEYSRRFSEKISSEFFTNQEHITGKEILNITPSKQVNFLVLKILFGTWQDEMKKLESPYFNYRDNDVRKAMVNLMNILSQKIQMDEDHFYELLEEAVFDTLVLGAAPGKFLYDEFIQKDIAEVNEKLTKPLLKYIKLHRQEIEQFFEETNEQDINDFLSATKAYFDGLDTRDTLREELALLSEVRPITLSDVLIEEEVEEEMAPVKEEMEIKEEEDTVEEAVFNPFGDDLTEELDPLSDEAYDKGEPVSDEPDEEPENGPDDEGDMDSSDDSFMEETEDRPAYSFEAGSALSDDVGAEREIVETPDLEESSLQDDEDETPEEDLAQESEQEEVASQVFEPEVPEQKEPEPEMAEPEMSDPEPELEEEEPHEPEDAPLHEKLSKADQTTINDRFTNEDKFTVADKLEDKNVQNIMEAISVNHRYMFTKELFDGDRDEFNSAISRVEKCESFDDAVETLVQDYAKDRDWDMNSEEVKELLKVVFRKFR